MPESQSTTHRRTTNPQGDPMITETINDLRPSDVGAARVRITTGDTIVEGRLAELQIQEGEAVIAWGVARVVRTTGGTAQLVIGSQSLGPLSLDHEIEVQR